MSELMLDELCRRFRYMVQTQGHYIDYAYDRTRDISRAKGRRWIWGNLHAIVDFGHSKLVVRDWQGNHMMLSQQSNGVVIDYPVKVVAEDLLVGLRAEMVLDELAGA